MEAEHLISAIIDAHDAHDDSGISITDSIRIVPQLNYSGKMAKEAYDTWKYYTNSRRDYVGILDFKIIQNNIETEHEKFMIEPAVTSLSIDEIRRIHGGIDPLLLPNLTNERKDAACCLQAGFVEQEINWGVEDFQVWSHFGRPNSPDVLLRMSSPRDLLCLYIERCKAEIQKGQSWIDMVQDVIAPFRKGTIQPPLDENKMILPDFRKYMPPQITGRRTENWIQPHIASIRLLCEKLGPNPMKELIYSN